MKTSNCQRGVITEKTLNYVFFWKSPLPLFYHVPKRNGSLFIVIKMTRVFEKPWKNFTKNPKSTLSICISKPNSWLVTKIDFRTWKHQLRMFEKIFDFSCNPCREINVVCQKGPNVVFSKTMPTSFLSSFNHRETVKHLILFHVNVIHFRYIQRRWDCSEYFF